jgi:hypothetical protein
LAEKSVCQQTLLANPMFRLAQCALEAVEQLVDFVFGDDQGRAKGEAVRE